VLIAPIPERSPGQIIADDDPVKVVVLVHGFRRTKNSMYFLQKALEDRGYEVVNRTYPSGENTIENNATFINDFVTDKLGELPPDTELYFVTHSMGGLVVRCYLEEYRPEQAKRLIMIAPPNRGATMAEYVDMFPISDVLLGPSGEEMAMGEDYLANLCGGVPDIEFGIIAGGRGDGEGYSSLLEGDDDGTVSVRTTYLPGAVDFLVLDHIHTFICDHQDTIDNVVHFLENGRFILHTAPPD
jgi:pimeloyl-ACP methyl ester carboxylesterase